MTTATYRIVLGLDLGVGSVGWALVRERLEDSGWSPESLADIGVRVFEKGMEEDQAGVKRTSRAAARRIARSARRRIWRRATRKRGVSLLLQEIGLLPSILPMPCKPGQTPVGMWCSSFDYAWWKANGGGHVEAQVIPYRLRAEALNRPLSTDELARTLLHLSQRRGFLSNRIGGDKEDEKELGKVKKGISELQAEMEKVGAPTLGAYLATLDPHQTRIRERWTKRSMFEEEFEAIMDFQSMHHPVLSPEVRARLHHFLFFQRPIWWDRNVLGRCELEPSAFRAPMASLEAQRFRILQRVNDLKVIKDFGVEGTERSLNEEERRVILFELDNRSELSAAKARERVGLPKRGARFNFERQEDPQPFKGNVTASRIRAVIGGQWDAWVSEGRAPALVEDLRSIQSETALVKRLKEHWGLTKDVSEKLAETPLESSRLRLSRKALAKLLPLMEKGMPYSTARQQAYPNADRVEIADLLPLVAKALPNLANPMVARTLTELRKVVNAIIRKHGKPDIIRVELARDLKNTEEDRKEIAKRNKERKADRDRAAKALKDEFPNPKRADIEKWLLWEECNHQCPYTERSISFEHLFRTGEVQIEHIWPFSRSGHDGYHNKTLCFVSENQAKGNRTPWEAYHSDPVRFEAMLGRVGSFQGMWKTEKMRRFEASEIPELAAFIDRELNDTRYISKLACSYLARIYGGLFTKGGERYIFASKGGVTAHLRRMLGLEELLHRLAADLDPEGKARTRNERPKPRDDHRHHAVDALVVALTAPPLVQALARMSEKGVLQGRLLPKGEFIEAWPGFAEEVDSRIRSIYVSRRVRKKADGQFHDATFYGPAFVNPDSQRQMHAVRKPLALLSKSMVEAIVDGKVKERVQAKLDKLGTHDPKVFAKAENLPSLPNRNGPPIPIRRVRIWVTEKAVTLGERSGHPRNVILDGNHHLEIFEESQTGKIKWIGRIVTLLESRRRASQKLPIVERTWGGRQDLRFVCSLAIGEAFTLAGDGGELQMFTVRTVYPAQGSYSVDAVSHLDAREKKAVKETRGWLVKAVNGLQRSGFQKVNIDPLGQIHPARD